VKAKIAKKNKKAKQIKKRIQQKQIKARKIQKVKIQKQKKQVARKQAKAITTSTAPSTAPSTPVTKKISTQDMDCNCNCVPKQQAKKLAQIDSSPITAEFLSDSFHGDNALF